MWIMVLEKFMSSGISAILLVPNVMDLNQQNVKAALIQLVQQQLQFSMGLAYAMEIITNNHMLIHVQIHAPQCQLNIMETIPPENA